MAPTRKESNDSKELETTPMSCSLESELQLDYDLKDISKVSSASTCGDDDEQLAECAEVTLGRSTCEQTFICREAVADSLCEIATSSQPLGILRVELSRAQSSNLSFKSGFDSFSSSVVQHTLSVLKSEVAEPDDGCSGLLGRKSAMNPWWTCSQIEYPKSKKRVAAWLSCVRFSRKAVHHPRLSAGERSLSEAPVKLRSRSLFQWRSRWAILTPHSLYLFRKVEDAADGQSTATDCLALSKIVEMNLAGKQMRIYLQTRFRSFVFHFKDASCAARWAELIRDCVEERGMRSVAFRSGHR